MKTKIIINLQFINDGRQLSRSFSIALHINVLVFNNVAAAVGAFTFFNMPVNDCLIVVNINCADLKRAAFMFDEILQLCKQFYATLVPFMLFCYNVSTYKA